MRTRSLVVFVLICLPWRATSAQDTVLGVAAQPLKAQVRRVAEALAFVGQPLSAKTMTELNVALDETDGAKAVAGVQAVLDPLCLATVNVNAESRVKVAAGAANKELVEQGWTVFLVKVLNEAGITSKLSVSSPNAAPLYARSSGSPAPKLKVLPKDVPDRWMDVSTFDKRPLAPALSGLAVEYRIVELFSRDAGQREATIAFDVGQGTQDLGFRNSVPILFDCKKAVPVTLRVVDHDGKPTTGQFVFRDERGRVYPSRARRLEPDFFFHDQIYRHDGEKINLPPGKYNVSYSRGPEYTIETKIIEVKAVNAQTETFPLKRWIHMASQDWFSGDHHIHAAGCAHYEAPTQGVEPHAMMRHILGEDLNVGCVLSWGPCWYHQKQFFDGTVHNLSTPDYLMRYDVEVSGFPSSHCGHLCLLRLKEDDYPGTTKIEEWPSWDLPVLKWGKEQGGVVGYSHSGWGLEVPGDTLPNFNMPRFDGIGANEYVVDVVHGACDFISSVDTPIIWELAIWYHTLNCGYTCRISGETDFPCIYGDRVGLGRVYVKLDSKPAAQKLNYDEWVFGLRDGRSYCGDGLSHLYDFSINGFGVGEKGTGGRASFLAAKSGEALNVSVKAAAMLGETPDTELQKRSLSQKPYWHVERARVGNTRKVPVELIVNGESVETIELDADGSVEDLKFSYKPERSCWVALRIFPTCHTNPIFVEVDGEPIRASKRSAQWCLDAVDVCWNAKKGNIRKSEQEDASAAFDVAREAYRRILGESFDDRN